jgi:hypothetical protein
MDTDIPRDTAQHRRYLERYPDAAGLDVSGLIDHMHRKATEHIRALREGATASPQQRLVQPDEVPQALKEGWRVKLQLSTGSVVLERP